MDRPWSDLLEPLRRSLRAVVFLTGAGVSAESGIPTFRGPEGYWTVGSRVYHPQELATRAAFARMPREVWRWYLYRLGVCRGVAPNPAHLAVAEAERILGDRFRLITQNVDGLHLRAGNSAERTFQVHGNIDFMRCARDCTVELFPLPAGVDEDPALGDESYDRLRCQRCGGLSRPHVLWFDESYDEPRFRFESSLAVAGQAALLITAGSSGATTLPNLVVQVAARAGALHIDVNPEENAFARAALARGGHWVSAPAGVALPEIVAELRSKL
jgi:NAD-dependent deacetylase